MIGEPVLEPEKSYETTHLIREAIVAFIERRTCSPSTVSLAEYIADVAVAGLKASELKLSYEFIDDYARDAVVAFVKTVEEQRVKIPRPFRQLYTLLVFDDWRSFNELRVIVGRFGCD